MTGQLDASVDIEVGAVSKSFGTAQVLHEVSFRCAPGRVTAFLGPNGAGKTTTLRICAGLSRPDHGDVRFGGRALNDYPVPGRVVGFAIDASSMHPGRSARETLLLTVMASQLPRSRVAEQLDAVGLASVARRRVGQLSLGMRQRLALACALSGRPQALVLDEPLNGLDIEGVLWVRELLRAHADAGGTVLLSTHLLKEAQTIADAVVVLDRGRVVLDGTLDALADTGRTLARSIVPEELPRMLDHLAVSYTRSGDDLVIDCDPAWLGRTALESGVALLRLDTAPGDDLEALFRRTTSGEFTARSAR